MWGKGNGKCRPLFLNFTNGEEEEDDSDGWLMKRWGDNERVRYRLL